MASQSQDHDPAHSPWVADARDRHLSSTDSDDFMASIGYEAADPSLQAPLWCEAMRDQDPP